MVRLARVVAPGIPHHITQRGNRRQQVFFQDEDYAQYLEFMGEWCTREGVEIWSYCLMPNHVHLIAVPGDERSLSRAIGEAHRRYTCHVNKREGWKGYLWQGRYSSFPMDEMHLLVAARNIECNPVQAGLVQDAWEYPWSSIHAHLNGKDEKWIRSEPLLELAGNWREFIRLDEPLKEDVFLRHERTGRPAGSEEFLRKLSGFTGRDLIPKKRGRKKGRK